MKNRKRDRQKKEYWEKRDVRQVRDRGKDERIVREREKNRGEEVDIIRATVIQEEQGKKMKERE